MLYHNIEGICISFQENKIILVFLRDKVTLTTLKYANAPHV